jgi:DNA replication and repair protein RecF
MRLRHLSLTHFRNYAKQELDLAPGAVLFLGENAQGKTNLLEAVFLLATGRSERADTDADFIAWSAREEPQPVARVVGQGVRKSGDVSVEVTVAGREGARGNLVGTKRFKLNGLPKRVSDVTGAVLAVLFTTDDMELVKGSPSGRRRYLDTMLTQVDHPYLRALQRYNKVVTQRNALLKRIQEGAARRDELAYWDEELSRDGAAIAVARAIAVMELAQSARDAHGRLSGERERFELAYEPRFVDGWPPARLAASDPADAAAALLEKLRGAHSRDIGAGVTLSGPHRDDLGMALGGESAASFASRGQQRTAALALRLAEAQLLASRAGERPILLLDDVLSELDESRRASVLDALDADQVMITSPDPDRFPPAFTGNAQSWLIEAGTATLI